VSTLVNAIFASGGPSPHGSMRSIQLRRGNQIICELDLYDLLLHGDKSHDARLEPGDVIFIPEAGSHVAIAGSVRHPAIYELKPSATLRNLLRFAEGPSALASTKQVHLQRIDDHSSLHVIHVSLNQKGLDSQLQSGDIIQVTPLVPHFDNAITLKGNVADAGRYPWKPGMRLSDLIPDKEALLTREYWDARNAEVQAADATRHEDEKEPEGSKAKDVPISYQSQDRNARGDSSLAAATELDNVPPLRTFNPSNSVQPLAPDIDWQYALIERTDRRTLETRKIPFNLGKLVLDHDQRQDLLLRPGDIVTIFSKADFSLPRSQQNQQVRIEGEVAMAGVYSVSPGETLRELVEHASGLTRDAYLYGAQFTRESTRREQQKRYEEFLNHYELEADQAAANLSSRVTSPQQAATAQASIASQRQLIEKLRKVSMNGRIVLNMRPNAHGVDSLPDLSLENGDRLYIPSRPSTVTVMGNVFEQTSFLYREDFRVGDYLKEAGGPTRNADRKHMFVIRADGSVISNSRTSPLFAKSFESRRLYPGDTIVVPAQLNRGTFLRSLTDWSQLFSNFALGAAAVNLLH
jgi:protein involved in polysaccharide export with SLBB domain